MAIAEIQETAAATTGTWGSQANTACSGGTRIVSSTAGATATFSVSGRSCWLVSATQQAGGNYTVTVDGLPGVPGTCFGVGVAERHRTLFPLFRNLPDAAHSVVITATTSAPVALDSLLVVSGATIVPVAGSLAALGDSVTHGYGLTNPVSSWPSRLALLLGRKLSRPFALSDKGISGDCLFGTDASHAGGMYRVFSDIAPLSPEVLTIMFGVNDIFLQTQPSGEFAANLLSLLQLVEDLFAVAQMAVIVCTPPYVAPIGQTCAPGGNQSGYYPGTANDHYRLAIEQVKQVASMFGWANIAYTYECMDEADSLIFPNGAFDSTHPGDGGHGVMAIETFRSVLERFGKIGKA